MTLWKNCCRALAVVALLGCDSETDEGPVVARVGDAALTVAELDNRIPSTEQADEQRRRFVEGWLRQELIFQEAVAQDLHQNPRVQRLVEQAQRDLLVAAFLDLTFEDRQIDVTEDEVERYYHLHADEYTRPDAEIRAQHILIGSRRDANALRAELLRGADFEDKAEELSIDRETLSSGGDLGYFTADEHPELWEACAGLGTGEISSVVSTGRGYHIVRLLDRKEAGSTRSLEEAVVREQIYDELVRERHRERVDSLVSRLQSEHSWQIDETLLSAQ